jgi:hypothetical protein
MRGAGPLRVHPDDLALTPLVAAGSALVSAALGLTTIPRLHHLATSLAVSLRQALLPRRRASHSRPVSDRHARTWRC